jgi:hypothetical protein
MGAFRELTQLFARKIIDKYHAASTQRALDVQPGSEMPETFIYGNILFNFAANYEGFLI